MIFRIDSSNVVTAYEKKAEARKAGEGEVFTTVAEFRRLADEWPLVRLVEIWNGLAGVEPTRRFSNRKTGVDRIWEHLQTPKPNAASKQRPTNQNEAAAEEKAATATRPEGTKAAQVIALLKRPGGATLQEIETATAWQAHSVRGFISGTLRKKLGLVVASTRSADGERSYSIR